MKRALTTTLFALSALSAAGSAFAAVDTLCAVGGTLTTSALGNTASTTTAASTYDATFGVTGSTPAPSDACILSDAGNGGNTDGGLLGTAFSGFGTGNFVRIGKIDGNGAITGDPAFQNVTFSLSGTGVNPNSTTGTWTLAWTGSGLPVTLDLVLAIHASNRTTSWLFDEESLTSQNTPGTGAWTIQWYNNGGSIPGFSNLTAWARLGNTEPCTVNCEPEPCTGQCNPDIPEPGTIALLGAGALIAGGRRYLKGRKQA